MSALLELRRAGYSYPRGPGPALQNIDLVVSPGELVLLTGPTGCGKSTLVRLAAGLLGRHGDGVISGEVRVDGEDPAELRPHERAERLGFVSQTPDRQLLTGSLGDEIAFPLESLGSDLADIDRRVLQQLSAFGLPPEPSRSTDALSGGQRQRLVTASAMAGGAPLLLLDEPLAQLDPQGAAALMKTLRGLVDVGTAVVIVEHRLAPTLPVADRVVVMEAGMIVADMPRSELDLSLLRRLGMRIPGEPSVPADEEPEEALLGPVLVEAGPLRWRYRGSDRDALDVSGFVLRAGERVALLGANGSGKSSLIAALMGDLKAGSVRCEGRLLDLPQDPDLALFSATVEDELAHGPREQRLSEDEIDGRVREAAHALSVQSLLERAPHGLSRGQRLRVAVGAVLTCEPMVVLLDEPTSGQDHGHVRRMMRALRSPDRALLFATHDEDLARDHATRILRMKDGAFVEECATDGGHPADALEVSAPRPLPTPPVANTGLDPRARLALLLCVGVLAVVLSRASSLGALALAAGMPLLFLGLSRTWLLRGGLALLAIVWSTVLSQGLFYAELPRVPLLRVGPVVIWTEGVLWGLVQSLRFTATLLAGIAVAISTPASRIHGALLRLRVPFGLAFLASMSLRAVPETARSVWIVRWARARRGRPLLARSPWAWLRLEVELLRPVIAEALRRARSLAEALDSRGFDPAGVRPERSPLRFTRAERALLVAAVSLTVGAATARILFVFYAAEILYLPWLRPLYGFVRAWL